MKKLIIFGDGQIADIMSYYFQEQSEYNVECFCIDDKFHKNKKHLGKPLISFSKLKKNILLKIILFILLYLIKI